MKGGQMDETIYGWIDGCVVSTISLVIAKRYTKLNTITVYVWFEHKYDLSLGLLDLQDKIQVSTDFSDKSIQCDYWNYTNISGNLYLTYVLGTTRSST